MARGDKQLLDIAKQRYTEADEAFNNLRTQMIDDIKFDAGDQWPTVVRSVRETSPHGARPCLTINKAATHRRAITNQMKQNRPQMRVNPVDSDADPETAKMLNGLLRHIQNNSMADQAYDYAVTAQVTCGLGYFKIGTRVMNDDTNEQEICIVPIASSLNVRMDPTIETPTGEDAMFCFEDELMSRAEIGMRFGKRKGERASDWQGEDPFDQKHNRRRVKVTRYWWRESSMDAPQVMVEDLGAMSEEDYDQRFAQDPNPPQILYRKRARTYRTYWALLAGNMVLEKHEFPSRYIPIIRVVGEERWIDGQRDLRGLIRDIADPCRMYNYWASAHTERVALEPKVPWTVAIESIEGFEEDWETANEGNKPYLPYKHVDEQGNPLPPPERTQGITGNPGLLQALLQAADDIKSASGQFNESMGQESNAKSGRAIRARQEEGRISTYHFPDNFARSLRYGGTIVIDMIPMVYDTQRVARILGEDGTPEFAYINPDLMGEDGQPAAYQAGGLTPGGAYQALYNPTIGRYDVVTSVGPSYQTLRQEQAEGMSDILQANPALWQILGDHLVRSMDWPGAEEMAERMKLILPHDIQQMEEARAQGMSEGQVQAEQIRRGVMAEMAPQMEQLEMALQQAGAAFDESQQKVMQLEIQLKSKQDEVAQKAQEAQLDYDKEIQKATLEQETEVAVAFIESQGAQAAENGEEGDDVKARTANQMTDIDSFFDAILEKKNEEVRAGHEQMMSDHGQAMAQLAQAMAGIAQMTQATQALADAVNDTRVAVQKIEQDREATKQAVMEYLGSDQSEEALRRTISKVH